MHYYRNYKHGNPHIKRQGSRYAMFDTLKESFEAKFKKGNSNECWNWGYSKTPYGYGGFTFKRKRYIASRISYETYVGEIPEGMHVCHKCDNPSCVNPNHLFIGTVQENMTDMVNKNRSAKGSHHSQAKLNESSVKEIKKLLKQNVSHKELAEKFGVGVRAISKINLGQRWGYIQ